MRIIKKRDSEKAMRSIMRIIKVFETIPIEAFGNSAEACEKMTVVFEETAELAYIVDGIDGLNKGVVYFRNNARSMDEIMAISNVHIDTIGKNLKKTKEKDRKNK